MLRIQTLSRFLKGYELLRKCVAGDKIKTRLCHQAPRLRKTSKSILLEQKCFTEEGLRNSFSHEQQQVILKVLNTASVLDIRQYDITKLRAVNLERHRRRKGEFTKLEDVMEVEGFGLKHIQYLCDSILYGLSEDTQKSQESVWQQFSRPFISEEMKKNIQSIVSLHLTPQSITWLHMSRKLDVLRWDRMELESGARTYNHRMNLELTHRIFKAMPKADAYIMDQKLLKPRHANIVQTMLGIYQIESMLITLLNHDFQSTGEQRVFKIKDSLVGHYFDIKIGDEVVSSQATAKKIMSGVHFDAIGKINISPEEIAWYDRQEPSIREELATCLLQAIAFYKLEVMKIKLS